MTQAIDGLRPVVTKYLVESPQENYIALSRRATLHNLAAKIALVAITLIATATMAIVLMGLTLTGIAPIALVGSIFATPLLYILNETCYKIGKEAKSLAEIENAVGLIFEKISNSDLEAFEKDGVPIQSLGDIKERLVLLARFIFWRDTAILSEKYADELLGKHPKIDEILAAPIDPMYVSELCYKYREKGFFTLENETLPAIMQSAVMLQLIINPYQNLEISDVGQTTPKPLHFRLSERTYDQLDTYLIFKDKSIKPLNS
jgi:hypothetical protein